MEGSGLWRYSEQNGQNHALIELPVQWVPLRKDAEIIQRTEGYQCAGEQRKGGVDGAGGSG